MLRCGDGSIYTGIAADVKKRVKQHLGILKNGAKYTRSHRVVYIEAVWSDKPGSSARKAECVLKRLSRTEKENLIKNPENIGEDFEYTDPKELNEYFGFVGSI